MCIFRHPLPVRPYARRESSLSRYCSRWVFCCWFLFSVSSSCPSERAPPWDCIIGRLHRTHVCPHRVDQRSDSVRLPFFAILSSVGMQLIRSFEGSLFIYFLNHRARSLTVTNQAAQKWRRKSQDHTLWTQARGPRATIRTRMECSFSFLFLKFVFGCWLVGICHFIRTRFRLFVSGTVLNVVHFWKTFPRQKRRLVFS